MTNKEFSQKHQNDSLKIVSKYNSISRYHDLLAKLPYLFGFREHSYRRKAVNALHLKPGDLVVDLGCGTGLNFALLEPIIGNQGKIIGVDMSSGMLAQAQKRIHDNDWQNIELVQSDIVRFQFPDQVNGILSTWVLSFLPDCTDVILRGCGALTPSGHWAITDQKIPENWPNWSAMVYATLTRQFGITSEMMLDKRWYSVRETISKALVNIVWGERYLGFVFIDSGGKRIDMTGNNKERA